MPLDIKQTNLANFGTDLERQIKKAAAECEEQWKGVGQTEGLKIWRIEKFKVVPWPEDQYGQFYRGDSYIVLKTYKKGNKFAYDVHFWLGSETTQDEAGTAAYKTVELDTLLDDVPVQHREVEGHETSKFTSYFPTGIRLLEGGIESGFNHVEPEKYEPRLLHVKGTFKTISCIQVPLSHTSLNSGDVFILDCGLMLYQWNGSKSSGAEKNKAAQLCRAIDDERRGLAEIEVHEEGDESPEFWEKLGGKGPVKSAEEGGSDHDERSQQCLFQLSDASGKMEFKQVGRGKLNKTMLDTNDAFILDAGHEVFAWIGLGASKDERTQALHYAQQYLNQYGRPAYTAITRIMEGGENEVFEAAFAA